MKTIICPQHLKTALYHRLAEKNGHVTDTLIQSMSTLFHLPQTKDADLMLQSKHLLQAHAEQFPIYRAMFAYTAFIQELLAFAKTCALFGITEKQLPQRTGGEKELRAILTLLLPMITYEQTLFQQREEIKQNLLHIPDLSICTGFEKNIFLYHLQNDLIKAGVPAFTPQRATPKNRLLRTALNLRQEAEAVVQDICKSMQPSLIVLCSYAEQFPVLQSLLERYHVPYSCVNDLYKAKIYAVFRSLITFALEKDIASFLQVLTLDGFSLPCPDHLYLWLGKTMQSMDLCAPDIPLNIFAKEAEHYFAMQKEAVSYMQAIQAEQKALLQAKTPPDILKAAYRVLLHHPLIMQEKERTAAMTIHSFLQTVLTKVHTDDDVRFITDFLLTQSTGQQRLQGDFVTVTDIFHPVDARKRTYVLHTDGRSYPGFSGRRGLFDEDYVAQIDAFPSLSRRHQAYMEQLQWIEQSASDVLFYSYPSADYQGNEMQLAYAIEAQFPNETRKKWPLDQLEPFPLPAHALTSETAAALFAPKGFITGSVSTIERWFACPYSWFIQAGLLVRQKNECGMDPATFGTIQHALMERAVTTFGKQYAEEASAHLDEWIRPYIDALLVFSPNEAVFIRHTLWHLRHNLLHTFHVLAAFERHTSFTPMETEKTFQEEIVNGVQLRGVIDRIDLCHHLLRIIDYKSSIHTLSTIKIKAGLQLQLLTYLHIAERLYDKKPTAALYCSTKDERYLMPAAAIYRHTVSKTPADEKTQWENFLMQRRLCGWIFDDDHKTEQDDSSTFIKGLRDLYDYPAVTAYMQMLYTYFHDEVLSGNIHLNPVDGACTFCDYRPICRFHGEMRKEKAIFDEEVEFKIKKTKETK